MCGIYGIYNYDDTPVEAAAIARMGASLVHRGPDGEGQFVCGHFGFGNRRLAILDVLRGTQPFFSADRNIAVVQNGEIYNYVELGAHLRGLGETLQTACDTEVILKLFERSGHGFVPALNGMFAIAIYDRGEDVLWLYRDRLGVKPLFYSDDGKRLCFASEIKGLLALGIPRAIDCEALEHYLSFNYVPPPFSLFRGVRQVLPGEWLRVSRAGVQHGRWWDLAAIQPGPLGRPASAWQDELEATLDEAVRIRLRSDVPYGAFLSGGIDSSAIVAAMTRSMDARVLTFSIGFSDPGYDESPFAEEISRLFTTRHAALRAGAGMIDLWPLATYYSDQPHGDTSFLPTYLVSRLAAGSVKVVLTGEGSDELLAGYDRYLAFLGAAPGEEVPGGLAERYFWSVAIFSEDTLNRLFRPHVRRQRPGGAALELVRKHFDRCRHLDPLNRLLYVDVQTLLPGNNLVKPDRMGMAVSIEARTPFLDVNLVELAFRMPGGLKVEGGHGKAALRHALRARLPQHVLWRRKHMFSVPLHDWLAGPWKLISERLLLDPDAHLTEWLDRRGIAAIVDDHFSGRLNRARQIRALLALELWCRICLHGDRRAAPTLAGVGLRAAETAEMANVLA